MYELAAFGRPRGTGGVEHDEQRLGLWPFRQILNFQF